MYNIFNNNTIKENIILRNFKLNLKMSQFDKKKKKKDEKSWNMFKCSNVVKSEYIQYLHLQKLLVNTPNQAPYIILNCITSFRAQQGHLHMICHVVYYQLLFLDSWDVKQLTNRSILVPWQLLTLLKQFGLNKSVLETNLLWPWPPLYQYHMY